jgi:hypothetical protein
MSLSLNKSGMIVLIGFYDSRLIPGIEDTITFPRALSDTQWTYRQNWVLLVRAWVVLLDAAQSQNLLKSSEFTVGWSDGLGNHRSKFEMAVNPFVAFVGINRHPLHDTKLCECIAMSKGQL